MPAQRIVEAVDDVLGVAASPPIAVQASEHCVCKRIHVRPIARRVALVGAVRQFLRDSGEVEILRHAVPSFSMPGGRATVGSAPPDTAVAKRAMTEIRMAAPMRPAWWGQPRKAMRGADKLQFTLLWIIGTAVSDSRPTVPAQFCISAREHTAHISSPDCPGCLQRPGSFLWGSDGSPGGTGLAARGEGR
jgi:hypothetical protein